jgi:hypothetical protein
VERKGKRKISIRIHLCRYVMRMNVFCEAKAFTIENSYLNETRESETDARG